MLFSFKTSEQGRELMNKSRTINFLVSLSVIVVTQTVLAFTFGGKLLEAELMFLLAFICTWLCETS